MSATIVMPTTTPLVKVNNTKDYGAKVIGGGHNSLFYMKKLLKSTARHPLYLDRDLIRGVK